MDYEFLQVRPGDQGRVRRTRGPRLLGADIRLPRRLVEDLRLRGDVVEVNLFAEELVKKRFSSVMESADHFLTALLTETDGTHCEAMSWSG